VSMGTARRASQRLAKNVCGEFLNGSPDALYT